MKMKLLCAFLAIGCLLGGYNYLKGGEAAHEFSPSARVPMTKDQCLSFLKENRKVGVLAPFRGAFVSGGEDGNRFGGSLFILDFSEAEGDKIVTSTSWNDIQKGHIDILYTFMDKTINATGFIDKKVGSVTVLACYEWKDVKPEFFISEEEPDKEQQSSGSQAE